MFDFILAQIFGAIALFVLVLSFQKTNKSNLLIFQVFSSLLYAFQYLFLNAYVGFFMNMLCAIRNFIFFKFDNKIPLFSLLIIVSLMVILSAFSFNGLISILPTIAVIIYSIALWYGKLFIIRVVDIISCILYIIYNVFVLAYFGIIATVIEMLSAFYAIYRYNIKKKSF